MPVVCLLGLVDLRVRENTLSFPSFPLITKALNDQHFTLHSRVVLMNNCDVDAETCFLFLFILSAAAAICIWKSLWCLYLKHAALWSLWLVQYEYTTLTRSDLKRRNEAKLVFRSELNLKGAPSLFILSSQVWINLTLRWLTNQLTLLSSGLLFFASELNQILFINIF